MKRDWANTPYVATMIRWLVSAEGDKGQQCTDVEVEGETIYEAADNMRLKLNSAFPTIEWKIVAIKKVGE